VCVCVCVCVKADIKADLFRYYMYILTRNKREYIGRIRDRRIASHNLDLEFKPTKQRGCDRDDRETIER